MSDDKNVNWRPPMKAPQIDYSKMLKQGLYKITHPEWMKTSLWEHTPKTVKSQSKTSKNKSSSASETSSYEVQKLHSKWKTVMEVEVKFKQNRVKIDPNISVNFFEKVTKVAKRLNCNPEDLAAIIYIESHFDPQTKSSSGNYVGLIQMDKTSFDSLEVKNKCTYSEYCQLPREKQLKYAEAYLKFRIDEKGLSGKKLSGGQIYTLIHRPKDIDKPSAVRVHQRRVDEAKKVPEKMKKINMQM